MNRSESASRRILVAGIGNIFLGDDAFGVEVVRRMAGRPWPAGVTVVDYGIRGLDLTYALLDDYEMVILVDATRRGGEPGTLYVLEPDWQDTGSELQPVALQTHEMNPMNVLNCVRAMGGRPNRIVLVGCEPAVLEHEEGRLGLSKSVEAAAGEAINVIESLIAPATMNVPVSPATVRPFDTVP